MKYFSFLNELFKKVYVVFLISILIINTAFLENNEMDEDDVFVSLHKKVEELNKLSNSDETKKNCLHVGGNGFLVFFKKMNLPSVGIRESKEINELGKTFNALAKQIDQEIHDAVILFSKSGSACSEEKIKKAKKILKIIMNERKSLLTTIKTNEKLSKKYLPENDEIDTRFFEFTETKKLMERFTKKTIKIKETLKNLKSKNSSNAWGKYSWSLSKKERQAIEDRASSRAESYYNDFVSSLEESIYEPMYRERSNIISSIGKLPEGRSTTDYYSWSWDDNFTEKTKKNLQESTDNYLENNTKVNILNTVEIKMYKKIEADMARYNNRLQQIMKAEEDFSSFDPSLSKTVIDSLAPFHQTLKETERLLGYQSKALKSVISRQKIE